MTNQNTHGSNGNHGKPGNPGHHNPGQPTKPGDPIEETPTTPGEPVEETPEEGAPEEGAPEEGAPEEGAPEEGTPVEGAPEEGAPVEETPVTEEPVDETPVTEEPVVTTPICDKLPVNTVFGEDCWLLVPPADIVTICTEDTTWWECPPLVGIDTSINDAVPTLPAAMVTQTPAIDATEATVTEPIALQHATADELAVTGGADVMGVLLLGAAALAAGAALIFRKARA